MKILNDLISILNVDAPVKDIRQGVFQTVEHLLDLCDPRAYVIILGDTAPLSPILFDYGFDAISGIKVVDPELAFRCVSQGANFRQIKGVKRLTLKKP